MNSETVKSDFAKAAPLAMVSSLLLLIGAAAFGAELSFWSNTAVAKFTADDMRILQSTAFSLLNGGTLGETRDWANPNSTAKGTIKIVRIFTSSEGFSCKTLRLTNSAEGAKGEGTQPVCGVKRGDWKIYSGAKPANP